MGGDVAVTPVGVAHRRAYLRDVQELVDEREQSIALPLDGPRPVSHFLRVGILQVVAQSEDDGKRRAELVGDVGKEVLAQGRKSFQRQMVAPLNALDVEESRQYSYQRKHHQGEDGIVGMACRPLLF